MKIRIPIPPLANSRNKKLPSFYPGIPQGNTNTPDHLLQELLQKSHFDNVELDAMYSQYLSLSTLDQEGGGITRLTFEQALGPLGLEKNLITDRIFRFFDQDDDGIINFKEMACGLSVLCKGNFDEKIDFAFQGYDLDGDGYISREELHEMFKAYFYLSMELIRDVVKTMENDLINSFEYQPGMPISSTFTAPIPREIGVRTNNSQNDNNNNTNGNGHRTAQERRRNREQTPLAEWSLPVIPSDESSGSSTPASSPSVHGSGVAVEEEFEEPVTGRVADRLGSDEPRESTLPSGWYVADALMNPQDTDDEDTKTGVDDVKEIDDEGTGILAATDGDIEKSQSTGLEMPESPELGRRRDSSDSEESETDTIERRVHSPTPVPSDGDHSLDHPSGSNSFQTSDGLPGTSPAVVRDSLEASSGDEDEGSSSSWSRPRKDQPLPLTTSSPHLAVPSLSNTNFAWERPHHRTGSSGSYLQVSPAAPSLAPALAIGFGLPHGATSTSSSSSSPSSSSSTQNRHISRASRTSDFNDRRRPSLGGPFHSFGPSSSAPTGSYANSSYFSGTFPVMESISQDAIQEMVDKTFSAIKDPSKPGFITLEEFRAYVLTDAGILGWFDALGSIF
ncbi:hypothetical protein BGZ65_001532 [Modicella reniformis]|uniref:EF-hand domain-containing protein n=1 Tax=Modicella reniformis TaxID=1440133 RepID=A0A9P6M0X8_9FUNG|nr:hypothetical protein BGZ65_001532 [Modicella reniformis]